MPNKPTQQEIRGLVITPDVAARLAEQCDDSKPMLEDDTLNEDAAGADEFCRWAVMAFPKGDWAKFKAYLLDFERYAKELEHILQYYDRLLREIAEK